MLDYHVNDFLGFSFMENSFELFHLYSKIAVIQKGYL